MAILEIEVAAEEQARVLREAELAGLSITEWAKRRLFGNPPITTEDGEVYEIPADLSQSTATAEGRRYTSVEEQVEYGSESVDEGRKTEVSVRDLVYSFNTIGEMIGFFHNPDHYPNLAAVSKFIGTRNAGALHVLADCYYHKLYAMLPEYIHDGYDGEPFDNPSSPYHHP